MSLSLHWLETPAEVPVQHAALVCYNCVTPEALLCYNCVTPEFLFLVTFAEVPVQHAAQVVVVAGAHVDVQPPLQSLRAGNEDDANKLNVL
jgi:hypothetical protein